MKEAFAAKYMPAIVKAKLTKPVPKWFKTYEELKKKDTEPLSESEEDNTDMLDSKDKSIEIELYTNSSPTTQKEAGDTSRRGFT